MAKARREYGNYMVNNIAEWNTKGNRKNQVMNKITLNSKDNYYNILITEDH